MNVVRAIVALFMSGCICEPGGLACGSQCVNPSSDPDHCGGCYYRCDPGDLCVDGYCRLGPECATDADCDDGLVCNGLERCSSTQRCYLESQSIRCSDGIGCTRDECLEPSGTCQSIPDDALCDAGSVCAGDGAGPSGCTSTCPGGAPGECDPMLQCGCSSGEGCYVGASPAECLPAGEGTHGEDCGGTSCAPGHHCIRVTHGAAAPVEICRQNCEVDGDCPDGGRCEWGVATTGGTASSTLACTVSCDLASQDCLSGMGCQPFGNPTEYTDCTTVGVTPIGGTCTLTGDCRAGSLCVNVPEGGGRCLSFCRVGGARCASGLSCRRLTDPLLIDDVEYGVCF